MGVVKKKPVTDPVEPERAEFLRKKSEELPEHLRPLEKKLLSLGGSFALIKPNEKDHEKILSRGERRPGKGKHVYFLDGEPSRCHETAAEEAAKDPAWLGIATGYALSQDGVWRQHSWGHWHKTRNIVESTEERVLYFGFVLRDEEALGFIFSNVRDQAILGGYLRKIVEVSDAIHERRKAYGP